MHLSSWLDPITCGRLGAPFAWRAGAATLLWTAFVGLIAAPARAGVERITVRLEEARCLS